MIIFLLRNSNVVSFSQGAEFLSVKCKIARVVIDMSTSKVAESTSKKSDFLFSGLTLILGGLFIFGGLAFSAYNIYQLSTFEKISAKVGSIGETKNTGKAPATIYEIWVGFDLPKQIVYTSAGKSLFYSPYQKGDVVEVYYNPQNPKEAFVHTFGTTWFIPVVFLFLPGLGLVFGTIIGMLRSRR